MTAYTQTCPAATPDGGPFTASSYQQLSDGGFGFGAPATKLITATGDPLTSLQFDPIAGTTDACKSVSAPLPVIGVASYSRTTQSGFTMLGLPTVTAKVRALGDFGELDSLLFDVAPDGSHRLVSRGAYRLTANQTGTVSFQLHGNGYAFAPGHTAKLLLLGSDAPYLRPSNNVAFTVQVSQVNVSLPTASG